MSALVILVEAFGIDLQVQLSNLSVNQSGQNWSIDGTIDAPTLSSGDKVFMIYSG